MAQILMLQSIVRPWRAGEAGRMFEAGRRYSDAPVSGVSLGPVDAGVLTRLVADGFARNDTNSVTVSGEPVPPGGFVRGPARLGLDTVYPLRNAAGVAVGLQTSDGSPIVSATSASAADVLAPSAPPGPYTVAATPSQAGAGVIGTAASATSNAADILAKQTKVTLPAGTRAVTIDYSAPAGLACGPLWVCIEPRDDQSAAAKLAVRGREVFRLLPGQRQSFGVQSGDADLTRIYLVAEFAAGSGYAGASVYVQAFSAAVADQITARWLGQTANSIKSEYLYLPFSSTGASANTAWRKSNVAGLTADIATVGADDFATNIPGWTLNGSSYYVDRSAAMAAFASLAAGDQMLMLYDFSFPTNPSGQYVWSMGASAPAGEQYGGYGVQFPGAGSAKLKWQPNGDSLQDIGSGSTVPIQTTGARYSGACLLDCRNDTIRTALAGAEGAQNPMLFPTDSSKARYPQIKAAVGCSFGGRAQSSGALNIMQSGAVLYRMLMLKSKSDISADFLNIAIAAARFPDEIPAIIRGM